jgi:hypothetical protein
MSLNIGIEKNREMRDQEMGLAIDVMIICKFY